MSNINDLITAYHVGVVQGWAGEEQAQKAMEEIRADPDRFLLFAPPVYASGYQRPEHFSLHRISRRVLGKDVGGGVQQIGDPFAAGTMVMLANGSEKPIEQIRVGDLVLNHKSQIARVSRVIKKQFTGRMVTVQLDGWSRKLTATETHHGMLIPVEGEQFLVDQPRRVQFGKMRVGDFMLTPPCSEQRYAIDKEEFCSDLDRYSVRGEAAVLLSVAPQQRTRYGTVREILSIDEQYVEDETVYCITTENEFTAIFGGVAHYQCVSWGMKHALEYLQTTMIALGKARIKYRPIFAPYLYGTGRVYVGKGRLGNGDGSLGSWMAEAVIKYGALFSDDKDVPTYSGSIAKRWGDPNPADDLDRFVKLGQERLVAKAPQVRSWDELCDLIAAGIPCTVASNQGFQMEPGRDGYHEASGSWPHQMMIYGYGPDYALICNSWGDVHGHLQCFHEKDNLPIATIRARRRTIEGMIRAGETFGVMDMRGSPLEPIPESLFRIVG